MVKKKKGSGTNYRKIGRGTVKIDLLYNEVNHKLLLLERTRLTLKPPPHCYEMTTPTTTPTPASPKFADLGIGPNGYAKGKLIDEGIYELLANALSASPEGTLPQIEMENDPRRVRLFISDKGRNGILPRHFVLGGGRCPSDTVIRSRDYGQHGIGMKDAIAILRRELSATITISSSTTFYEFEERTGQLGENTLHLKESNLSTPYSGTCFNIEFDASHRSKVEKAVINAKKSFLELCMGSLELIDQDRTVEMYRLCQNETEKQFHYIFVNGAKKLTSRPFCRIYNVKGELAQSIKAILTREHTVLPKPFNRDIYPNIASFACRVRAKRDKTDKCGTTLEFIFSPPTASAAPSLITTVPSTVPATVAVAASAPVPVVFQPFLFTRTSDPGSPILPVDAFDADCIHTVYTALSMMQNAVMYTLSPGERHHINEVTEAVKMAIRSTPGLSVARIGNSGSMAKHTAVPHSVDVDMVVFLNGFNRERISDYARCIKKALTSRQCSFLSSADDILQCVNNDIAIDIVLTSAESTPDPRYQEFQEGPNAVIFFLDATREHPWIAEVVRAGKYWIMRYEDGVRNRLKSVAVEYIVLHVFNQHSEDIASAENVASKRRKLFEYFLQFLVLPSEQQHVSTLLEPRRQEFENIKGPIAIYRDIARVALNVIGSI